MRRKDREITDRSAIDGIIRAARVMRIGLADGDEPYVVPLSFGYDGRSLFFHCAPRGRKIDIIGRNGLVCFEVDELLGVVESAKACGWGARYRSVIGTGRAVVLDDREAKRRGLEAIMAQYAEGDHHFPEDRIDGVCVVRIDIARVSGKQSPAREASP